MESSKAPGCCKNDLLPDNKRQRSPCCGWRWEGHSGMRKGPVTSRLLCRTKTAQLPEWLGQDWEKKLGLGSCSLGLVMAGMGSSGTWSPLGRGNKRGYYNAILFTQVFLCRSPPAFCSWGPEDSETVRGDTVPNPMSQTAISRSHGQKK